ncbi:maternal effect embryo arrest protein [Medicago truncatula]|uniref:Maternal effect embryo arrest protein n=2 Tax=Medicago truncatula TaxID=3880 RepID=A0A072V6T9_MEDTR|nr:maternal effect embryo arrest protein [Medicago truncatula]
MAAEQAFNPSESENHCCAELKKKYSKLQESRNALREAVRLLEGTVNNFQAQNANLKTVSAAYQEELARAKIEKEKNLKELNAKVSLENEVSALKSEITALQQKCGTGAQEENGDVKSLKADIYDRDKEIERLKKLVEKEKKRADSEKKVAVNEKKKAAEASKLLEAEKKVSLDKGMQLSKIEAEKAEEYRLQKVRLEKEVGETKMKLASELSKFEEAIKRVETEKQKLLVEKRNAESKMKKAQVQAEVEKQKAAREKRRADEEQVKVEEQKRLAKEAKHLADQRSLELLKDKKVIDDLKQRIHELSSPRKHNEISGVSPNVNAESDKIHFLKSSLELEKLRAKHAREKLKHERKKFEHERMKFKYEESCRNILQHELHRLKLDFIQNYNHLNMLDASFSPVAGSIHGLAKSQNKPSMQKPEVTTQLCSLGIGSKLEPLIGSSNRTSIQYAVNSSTASFSDAHLMGSQERGALQVTTSPKSAEENFNARSSMLKPSDRSVIGHDGIRNRISDTIECVANLSSEENDRPHKKRKKSHREKAGTSVETEDPKAVVYEDADGFRQTTRPALCTQTTQACREKIFDASNNFDEIYNGNVMKLLVLENAVDEERYSIAMNAPLSPLCFPETETFALDNMEPFQNEVLHTDLLDQRDSSPSTICDVIDVEMNSNVQKFDAITIPCNEHRAKQAVQTDVKLQNTHSLENLRDTFLVETETGSIHHQLPNFGLIVSDREDNSCISRTLLAARNCIARCSLDTQTEWAVGSILSAVDMEEISIQNEKHSVLLTLLLFNFTMTAMKFGGGNLLLCLSSYAEHICRVMTDADTRVLLLEKFSLLGLLRLFEDFLIEGKVILKNVVPTETSSDSNLRNDSFLDGIDTLCANEATNEQLVAASIILASLCAATDYIGFISEASYNILRLCRCDSFVVLTILHIFANLGGRTYFNSCSYGLMVTVLKSLVMFIEGGSVSVTTSCLPAINQLHTDLCSNVKCPFSEGAESIDVVTSLLLENIKKHPFQQEEQFDSSNFRSLSDNYNNGQCSNQDVVPCQLSDILSLLELVANKMSWQWTNTKLVSQLLHVLDSCAMENAAVAIIVLLGQLGRLGVDVGGYEDHGVENLRTKLLSYLCNSSMKAHTSLQIATATALFGLLPLDLESLSQTEFSLPAYPSKSISDDAGSLRKWFSGLGEHQKILLYSILRPTE